MIQIAIINATTVLKTPEIVPVVAALDKQLDLDWVPTGGLDANLYLHNHGDPIPPSYWQLVLLDSSDVAGALGYHDETSKGLPIGKVFAGTDLEDGNSWSVTMSHELLEMLGDPWINRVRQAGDVLYADEACDAVESDDLGYLIDHVLVSDFVLPSWYSDIGTAPFDFQGHCTKPFQLLPGGYVAILDPATMSWSQQTLQAEHAQRAPLRVGGRRERRMRGRTNWKRSTAS